MLKHLIFLTIILQSGCSAPLSKPESDSGYFADATSCFQSSGRKEYIKVPTAGTMTLVEVPIDTDAGNFSLCMRQAGHLATQAEPNAYLELSRSCLQQARGSSKPDAAYFGCISN